MNEFFIEIDSYKQGKFKGESQKEGHEEHLVGFAFEHDLTSAIRTPSNAPASNGSRGLLSFVKPWGPASPQLFEALLNDEPLKSVRFEFVRVTDTGEEALRTIELKKARVVAIEQVVDPAGDPAVHRPLELERISLSFVEMRIEHFPGTTVVSSQSSPIAAGSSRIEASRIPLHRRARRALELGGAIRVADTLNDDELKTLQQIARERRELHEPRTE